MEDDVIVAKLDELIAVVRAGAAHIEPRWLDAAGVGKLITRTPEYVRDRLAPRPDFPEANRVGGPRWNRDEVLQWMEDSREGKHKPGRKRKL